MSLRSAVVVTLCAMVVWTPSARAQLRLDADADLARTRFRTAAPGAGTTSSGFLVGGRASLTRGPVALAVSYAQGSLSADTGSAPASDLVDGSVFASVRPATWLALQFGPHLRALVTPGGTERWVLWEGRVLAQAPILTDVLWVKVGWWSTVASAVNTGPGAGGAHGGEAGLALRVQGSPLVFQLAYTVDHETLQSGAGTETLEAVRISLGLGHR